MDLLLDISSNFEAPSFLVKMLLNALALFAAAYFLKGVKISGFVQAIIVAIVLSILNVTLGRIVDFFTAPINWITLGLFSFVVDAIIILLAANFLKGFSVKGFWSAFWLAVLLAIFNSVLFQIYV